MTLTTVQRGLTALALVLACSAHAADFPARAVITMRGYWGFMPVGTAVLTWTMKDGQYHMENRMSGLGFRIRYVSDGTVTDNQLRPTYYAEVRGSDTQPHYESRFDWSKRTVSFGKPAEQTVVPLLTPVQDLNALPFDLAWHDGKAMTYQQLSNGRKLKRAAFAVEGEQQIDVGGRTIRAVYLVSRLPKESVEVWLAPAYNYMPVRIKYSGSEKIEMQATRVELDGKVLLGD